MFDKINTAKDSIKLEPEIPTIISEYAKRYTTWKMTVRIKNDGEVWCRSFEKSPIKWEETWRNSWDFDISSRYQTQGDSLQETDQSDERQKWISELTRKVLSDPDKNKRIRERPESRNKE